MNAFSILPINEKCYQTLAERIFGIFETFLHSPLSHSWLDSTPQSRLIHLFIFLVLFLFLFFGFCVWFLLAKTVCIHINVDAERRKIYFFGVRMLLCILVVVCLMLCCILMARAGPRGDILMVMT